MDIIQNIYNDSLLQNKRNLTFWEDYLNNLKSLDFGVYSEKLKVPILVPIGSRILFRGELKHTSEVTVALGANYFTKCSIAQAEILRSHRIKGAQEKVDVFKKEREYLENQFTFSKDKVFEDQGQEIIEHYTIEEDEAWRQQHRDNVRKSKQNRVKEDFPKVDDEELWNRLEELELQEELESELQNSAEEINDQTNFVSSNNDPLEKHDDCKETDIVNNAKCKEESNLDMLQKVLDKQNELEQKILDLKNRDRSETKTEKDLLSRLEEMEMLDELEDEMDRVDDIIENGNIEDDNSVDINEDEEIQKAPKIKRSVSFADDEDEPEVLELTFTHSDVVPDSKPYNPDEGITKPSDVYEAFKPLFNVETTSILKKGHKLQKRKVTFEDNLEEKNYIVSNRTDGIVDQDEEIEERTIVIKDVIEKQGQGKSIPESSARPTSLFKLKRQQRK